MNIEDAKRQFEILDGYRMEAQFSLKTIMAANKHTAVFDNTYEAHVLNHMAWALYQNIVLNLRKVVEPKSTDKHKDRPTIEGIVDILKEEKDTEKTSIIDKLNNEWNVFFASDYAEKLKEARHKIAHSSKEVEVEHPPIEDIEKILDQITSMLQEIDKSLYQNPLSYENEAIEIEKMANNFWEATAYGYSQIGDKENDNI